MMKLQSNFFKIFFHHCYINMAICYMIDIESAKKYVPLHLVWTISIIFSV